MKNKNLIWAVIVVCIIVLVIPNVIYYCKFSANGVSNDTAVWGQYGDYLGGSINPILTVFNIVALVYLTYTVSHVEDTRAKENINAQASITISQMRFERLKEITSILNSLANTSPNDSYSEINQKIRLGTIELTYFKLDNVYLFKDLFTQEFHVNYYQPLMKSIEQYSNFWRKHERDQLLDEDAELDEAINSYVYAKTNFVGELNKFTVSQITKDSKIN